MQGWIKLHRKIIFSDIFQNEKMLKLFIYCLTKASHKETEVRVGKQKVLIKPGQFLFGRKKAATEISMNESTIKDYMKTLKEDGVITIDSTNKYSVVTIVKWGDYQSKDEDSTNKIPSEYQQNDNKIPSTHQQNTTYKNVEEWFKNVKECEAKSAHEDPFKFLDQNIGEVSSTSKQVLMSFCEDMSDAVVVSAMKLALAKERHDFGFIQGILRNWDQKKIQTVEDVLKHEEEFRERAKKTIPFPKKQKNNDVQALLDKFREEG